MAMGNRNGDGDGVGNYDRDGNGDHNGNGHGKGGDDKGRVASSYAGDVQQIGRGNATPCLHPHEHKGKCIHQRCVMGVTLLRAFPPFQGGGFLTAYHGLFFCLLFTTTVQFAEQPSVCPLHYSGTQEPCQPIDALPPPLLKNPVSLLTINPSSYCTFCQGKFGQGLQ
jgi:hypothetical protein